MLIIQRTFIYINWAVVAIIVAIIALVILRLIVIQADLNPFGWVARTVRRLTDPIVNPVARSMARMAVDPKYAPLVTILITILLGYFFLSLAESVATSLVGMLDGVQRAAMVRVLGHFFFGLLSIYQLLIFMRIVFSWGMVSYSNRLMRFLVDTTEPLLGPLRRMIPALGMIDISPIFAFLIIWLFQAAIAGTLLRGTSSLVIQ